MGILWNGESDGVNVRTKRAFVLVNMGGLLGGWHSRKNAYTRIPGVMHYPSDHVGYTHHVSVAADVHTLRAGVRLAR